MRNLIIILFSAIAFTAFAQDVPVLSTSAEISLLTCSPGDDVYEAFGHTAIRVNDPENGLDFAFNYGTFDFGQPNFYFNFTKGRLLYMLSTSSTPGFVNYYKSFNRRVTEQVLNLTQPEKQRLVVMLDENLKPENREYLYDYFFDNCSTRPRDVILEAMEDQVSMDSSACQHRSIRQLTNSYMGEEQAWGRLGINICLSSSRIDRPATAWEYMYLPEELMAAFDKMTINRDSMEVPLVKETIVLAEMSSVQSENPKTTPRNVFVALLLVVAGIVTSFRVRGKSVRILEGSVFLFFGILSLLFLYLWLGTEHFTAHRPYSLLWAIPTHIIYGIVLFKKNRPIWIRWYSVATAIIMACVLAGWNMIPVEFLSELRFLVILQLFLAIGIIRSGARKPIEAT